MCVRSVYACLSFLQPSARGQGSKFARSDLTWVRCLLVTNLELATHRRGRAPLKMRVLVEIVLIAGSETGGAGGGRDDRPRSAIFELNSLPPGL